MKLYEALRKEAADRKQREDDKEFACSVFVFFVSLGVTWLLFILLGVL